VTGAVGSGAWQEPAQVLALLVVAHVAGDFLLQNERMAAAKERRWSVLLVHGLLVLAAHAALLAPFLSGGLAVGLVALAIVHVVMDAVRGRALGRWGASLAAFFTDQVLHVAAALVLWRILVSTDALVGGRWFVGGEWVGGYARWSVVAAAYVFNTAGGTRIVRGVLKRFPKAVPGGADEDDGEYAMGRMIGCLERYIALTLVLFGQWAALGFILVAKSIARFPEFRSRSDKDFAEYYLIGTLTSVLVALLSGAVLRWIVG
jgi:hypothetical protein